MMEEKENINVKEVRNKANIAKERFQKRKIAMDAYKKIGLGNFIDRLNKFSNMLLPQLGIAMGLSAKMNREIQNDYELKNKGENLERD